MTEGTPGSGPRESPPPAADRKRGDELHRRLGFWSASAILVGAIIGSGIFRVPSTVAAATGSETASLTLWVAGALITLCGVLTMAELAGMFPEAGGTYVYLRETFGPGSAFVFGWTRLLLIQPAVLGGIALIFAAYAQALVPLDDIGVRLVAIGVLLVLGIANVRSVVLGAAVQNASTAAKVLALAGLSVAVFWLGDPSAAGGTGELAAGAAGELTAGAAGAGAEAGAAAGTGGGMAAAAGLGTLLSGLGVALIAVLWSYDGWGELLYATGEVRDPGRNVPAALIAGSLVVAGVYVLVNAAFFHALPFEEVAASELVAADAATRVLGPGGAALVAGLVMLSTFGALNGALMGGPRVFFAMARDRSFFAPVGAVHPRFGTPWIAIILATVLGVAYVSLRTFEQLVEVFILGIWPFYVLVVLGVFRLRRTQPVCTRPYRTWGYPVTPVVFLIASIAMLVNALVNQPASTAFSFGIIALGVPAYLVWRRARGGREVES